MRTAASVRLMTVDLLSLANEYPDGLVAAQLSDAERVDFELTLVADDLGYNGSIIDIGGGIGMFPVACAASGWCMTLIDDLGDPVSAEYPCPLPVHDRYGVRVLNKDIVADPVIPMEDGSVDVVTTFDSIEHWHGSPRFALHEAMRVLRPGGLLVVGLPNCVNLRKRITVPLGRGKWSQYHDWYDHSVFRGHVREADTDDLRRMAADLELRDVRIFGRNWIAFSSPRAWVRLLAPFVDKPLRRFPGLCSDLYLVGRKRLDR